MGGKAKDIGWEGISRLHIPISLTTLADNILIPLYHSLLKQY